MPAPKPKWAPEPRGWTAQQTATYIGMSENWFGGNVASLQKKYGFPMPSEATGRYDGKAVSLWYDSHSGILPKVDIRTATDDWSQGLEELGKTHGTSSAH